MLIAVFDEKKGNKKIIASFAMSFVAFLNARYFPLHITIAAVSAHMTLLLGATIATFLQRKKNQQQKKINNKAESFNTKNKTMDMAME